MSIVRSISFRAALFMVFLCAVQTFAEPAGERFCRVTGIVGDVKVRISPDFGKVRRERAAQHNTTAGGVSDRISSSVTFDWTDLRLNMVLGEKCEIMTSAQSEVRLETSEGNIIRIGENSVVEIAMLRTGQEKVRTGNRTETITTNRAKFKVIRGNLMADIKKMFNEKHDVRFETPTAVAAIRGTTIEVEVQRGTPNTIIRAFDGTVLVAPAGSKRFVELKDGQMAEIAPKQKIIMVRPVPNEYNRSDFRLKGEADPVLEVRKPAVDSAVAASVEPAAEPAAGQTAVKLRLDLGALADADTISCYARDSITIEGIVEPATAKVSINDIEAVPDSTGMFRLSFLAPSDSGAFALNITAEHDTISETVIRMLNVAHVYTDVKLITPTEGAIVNKPAVLISGTAEPGSKVIALGTTINVKRDGTFSGEIALPDKTGNVKIQVEIVNKDNNAVWIERNIIYRK